jgi:hypothetical protein
MMLLSGDISRPTSVRPLPDGGAVLSPTLDAFKQHFPAPNGCSRLFLAGPATSNASHIAARHVLGFSKVPPSPRALAPGVPLRRQRRCCQSEPYLAQSLDVGELLTPLFKHDNGFGEAEPSLEQADLVDHVHPRLMLSVSHFILGREDDKSDGGRIQHFREACDVGDAGSGYSIKFIDRQMKPSMDEVLK